MQILNFISLYCYVSNIYVIVSGNNNCSISKKLLPASLYGGGGGVGGGWWGLPYKNDGGDRQKILKIA